MKHSYVIIDDSHESILNTQATAMRFQNLAFMGYASNYDDAVNLILEHQPGLIFLEINPLKKESNLSLNLINELYRYLTVVPKIIVTTRDQSLVFRAMEYGVADYLVKPLDINAFRKAIFKFEKSIVQNNISTPVVPQQPFVPQQTLTFSDFLRHGPIEKSITKEEVEPIIEEKEKEIQDDNNSKEIFVEEAIQVSSILNEETTTETPLKPVKAQETNIEFKIVEEVEKVLNQDEETEKVEVNENYEKLTSETENELEKEVEKLDPEKETTNIETGEETEDEENLDEETNDEETVTILPGQKIIVEQEQPLVICVKSYGDYRYIDSRDILYFEADNNSTDIHLKDGEMVTAFKTLKVFENVLPPTQFLRIHNSYIININQVARIHTGNTVCYIKNSNIKLPFSKSYKENVELIIHRIASGNYLEI